VALAMAEALEVMKRHRASRAGSDAAQSEVGDGTSEVLASSSRPSVPCVGLQEGVKAFWKCGLCKRPRDTENRNAFARPGSMFLVFKEPEKPESNCISCISYRRTVLPGESLEDIKATLAKSEEAQKALTADVELYEDRLEESAKSGGRARVRNFKSEACPPIIVRSKTTSSKGARMMVPNFWPEDVYTREYGKKLDESIIEVYVYKGVTYRGAYLSAKDHPPVDGTLLMNDSEDTILEKEQEIARSGVAKKGQVQKVHAKLQKEMASGITSTKGEDGTMRHKLKVPNKKSLVAHVSDETSCSEVDWKATLRGPTDTAACTNSAGDGSAGPKVKKQKVEKTIEKKGKAASPVKQPVAKQAPPTLNNKKLVCPYFIFLKLYFLYKIVFN